MLRKGSVLFRNRNFAFLLGGQWISEIGNTFFSLAIFWYVLQITRSPASLGIVGVVLSLPSIFGLVSGVIVDRLEDRVVMIVSDAIRAVLALAIALLAFFNVLSVVVLLILLVLLQIAGTFFQPASMALLPRIVNNHDRTEANGAYREASSSAALIGASGGGAVMVLLGPVTLFFINAVSFVVSAMSLGLIRLPQADRQPSMTTNESLITEWIGGFRYLWGDLFTKSLIFSSVTINMAMQVLMVLLAAWVKYAIHGTAFDYGLLIVSYVMGLIIGALVAAPIAKRVGMTRSIIVGLIGTALATAVFSRFTYLYWDLVPFFAIGFSSAVRNTAFFSDLQERVPGDLHGRVFGTLFSLAAIANPIGAGLGGLAAQRYPITFIYLLVSIVVLFSTIPLFRFWNVTARLKSDLQHKGETVS